MRRLILDFRCIRCQPSDRRLGYIIPYEKPGGISRGGRSIYYWQISMCYSKVTASLAFHYVNQRKPQKSGVKSVQQEDCFNDNNNNLGLAHKSPGNNTLQVVLNSAANCSLKPALSSFPHFLSSFSNQYEPSPVSRLPVSATAIASAINDVDIS